MKLLFCGPIFDFSGYSTASRNLLHALEFSRKFDLAARPLRYDRLDSGQRFQAPGWMTPLLRNDLNGVDMLLQMTTVNIEAVPAPNVCNGLYTFLESDRLQHSWANKANQFDFLLVPCRHNAEAMLRSGVTRPILILPPPCDTSVYAGSDRYALTNAGDRTIFYNISQLSAKKGIDVLIRAYFAAFADTPNEVLLVLKTYINMHDRSHDMQHIRNYISQIKRGCRIPVETSPPILPIIQTLSDEEIHGLHRSGHAYVCASRAEGWGYPQFDALGHGNVLISNDQTGLGAFVRNSNALVYGGCDTFFFDMHHPDPGLYTGVEQCFEPSPVQMAYLMRKFHTLRKKSLTNSFASEEEAREWDSILQRQINARQTVESFHFENVYDKVASPLEVAYEQWKSGNKISFGGDAIVRGIGERSL